MLRNQIERRNIISDSDGISVSSEVSRSGKRMFNSNKNKQTYHFGEVRPLEVNPYVMPAKKIIPDYNEAVYNGANYNDADYEEVSYNQYQLKENIPKPVYSNDPKREYAQQLLDQINLKNQKKAEENFEKEQILALRQWELQQFQEEEERKKAFAKQKTKEYREMLEMQAKLKKQIEGEKNFVRANSEPIANQEVRAVKSNRTSAYNPITGEPYEYSEGNALRSESFKTNDKSLANYGNLVVQARRPY